MNTDILIRITCLVIILGTILLGLYTNLLKDTSTAAKRPYSFSRVQFAWWTVIIFCCYIYILLNHLDKVQTGMPEILSNTALALLGISSATVAGGKLIDTTHKNNTPLSTLHQDFEGKGFFVDILSDEGGISIHRFQSFIFNVIFGGIFVYKVMYNKNNPVILMPDFSVNELALLGLSSGTYLALKGQENPGKKEDGIQG